MSRSNPFFNTSTSQAMPLFTPVISEAEYKTLHWEKQLEIRPLRDQRRYMPNSGGDFDTYIDMFDDNEIIEKETT
jgi:hypothetical protein